jgi:hypothetical protein
MVMAAAGALGYTMGSETRHQSKQRHDCKSFARSIGNLDVR